MVSESGVVYNSETATHLRERTFEFFAAGWAFRYTLEIPDYILRRLDSAAMDKLREYMSSYALRVVTDAIQGGWMFSDAGERSVRTDVGSHLKNYIWERFSIAVEKEGTNDAKPITFEVAPSLQRVYKS